MSATAGKLVRLKISGVAAALTNEATTDAGDHKNYQITNAARRVLDPQVAVVVQRSTDAGATWLASVGAYTLNRLTGTVTFAVANGVADQIRIASGSYLPMTVIGEGKSFGFSAKATYAEDVAFGDTDITRVQMQRMASGSIAMWWLDSSFLTLFLAGAQLVVEVAIASGATPIARAWALLTERSHDVATAQLQEEPLSWESTQDADGRSFAWLI